MSSGRSISAVKFKKKQFKSNPKGIKRSKMVKGNYLITSVSYGVVTRNHLETVRRYFLRRIGKRFKKHIRLRLTHTFFRKNEKSRMGKGSGKFYRWFGYVQPGMPVFEFKLTETNHLTPVERVFKSLDSKLTFKSRVSSKSLFFKF